MLAHEVGKAESNEENWWSRWVEETVWVTKSAYAIFSNRFRDESFFNHAGFLGPERDEEAVIDSIEKEFGKRGLRTSCVFVQDGSPWKGLRARLSSKGYKIVDVMSVMETEGRTKRKRVPSNPDVKITVMDSRSTAEEIREWSRTYLHAFYGSEKLLDTVQGIIRDALRDSKTSLVLAKIRDAAVGCAALHRTDDLVGAYCVGTVPDFRGRRVGATIMNSILEIAARERRKLVLQTMRSDSAEGFYLKQGFRRAYSKSVLTRRLVERKSTSLEDYLGVRIDRSVKAGARRPFPEVFSGFGSVEAVRRIFGRNTEAVLSGLMVSLNSPRGYLRVDEKTGNIIVNPKYLRTGQASYLYLDVIHELVHVRQFMEGKELYDMRYKYFERPTEIEAYQVVVEEARQIGMSNEEIVEYLRVEWVTEEEFERFASLMGVAGD